MPYHPSRPVTPTIVFVSERKRRSWVWVVTICIAGRKRRSPPRALAQSLSSVDPAAPVMDDEGMADSKGMTSDEVPMVCAVDARVRWHVRALACA